MTLSERYNPYNFDEFITWRNNYDYYKDDHFIQKVVKYYTGDEWQIIDKEAKKLSKMVSFQWRELSESIAYPVKHPYLRHYDGHIHRIDKIIRPFEIETMEKEIFSQGLFSKNTSPWTKFVKMFLIYQNSESCIACPLTCTEGMVALLEKYADTPELKHILSHVKEGINGDFAIGAQYLSEIQGGSDVSANLLEAVVCGDKIYKLYGTKFFCSAAHADYAVVTAKPKGSPNIASFIVPSWADNKKESRNNFTIDRLKWKMGTSELPTAEITFNGSIAYPIGPLDRGLANIVGIVLTYSRLTVGLSAASGMIRAAREAKKYSEYREAFGMKLNQFPMIAGQIKRLEKYAHRTTAGAFKLYKEFLSLEGGLKDGTNLDESDELKKKRFDIREMIMLQKITTSWDNTDMIRLAMSVFGGHGVIEDFSSLPRFYRDAAVNELWEGPRNVLLTQIYRDFQRVNSWYPWEEFLNRLLKGMDQSEIKSFSKEMTYILSYENLFELNDETIEICEKWDKLCHKIWHAYEDIALKELDNT